MTGEVARGGTPVAVLSAAVIVALGLGGLAIAADQISGPLGRALLLLSSTGPAWGAAALILGAWSAGRAVAAVAGGVALVGAVATYYATAVVFELRPSAGTAALVDAGEIWGTLGALAGPALALLGWHAVRMEGRARSAIWGVLAGLLLSQGMYLLFRTRLRPSLEPWPMLLLGSLCGAPAVVVFLGARRRHVVLGLAVMLAVGSGGAIGWSLVMDAI